MGFTENKLMLKLDLYYLFHKRNTLYSSSFFFRGGGRGICKMLNINIRFTADIQQGIKKIDNYLRSTLYFIPTR